MSISLSTDEIDEYLGDFSVIEDIWIDIEQENQGVTGLLIDIFMDALSLLQIPTSFIQSCLENVMGCVTKNVEMCEANVNVAFRWDKQWILMERITLGCRCLLD